MTTTASAPEATLTTRRGNAFDLLRLLAALAVVVQHSVVHLDGTFLWLQPHGAWWFYDGVIAFFVLSGYMVYQSAERCAEQGRSWVEYFRNRALRIIPAIYAHLGIMLVVLAALGFIRGADWASVPVVGYILSNLALAPVYHPSTFSGFGVGVVNGSLWTIPVEVSFYFAVPLVVLAAARWGRRVVLPALAGLAFFALAAVAAMPASGLTKLIGVTFVPWLWFFTLGIVWAWLWPKVKQSGWMALAAAGLYVAVATALHADVLPLDEAVLAAVAAVPLSYALLWLGHNLPQACNRFTARIGDLSFGAYIWHMPIVNIMLFSGLGAAWAGTPRVLFAIAATLTAAWLSWTLVESRALELKKYKWTPGADR